MFRLSLWIILFFSCICYGYASSGDTSDGKKGGEIKSDRFILLKRKVELSPFYTDDSILRYVSRSTPLANRDYTPSDLMSLSWGYIDEAGRRGYLRREARAKLGEMAVGFYGEFWAPLVVISGYRSASYQQRMWDLGKCTDSLCAPPGHSEHQLGLAVDLFDASTKAEYLKNPRYRSYVEWVRKKAHLYGWTESYTRGEALDEYEAEPWHWRYVGVGMATRLRELGWNYTEYVRFQEAIQKR